MEIITDCENQTYVLTNGKYVKGLQYFKCTMDVDKVPITNCFAHFIPIGDFIEENEFKHIVTDEFKNILKIKANADPSKCSIYLNGKKLGLVQKLRFKANLKNINIKLDIIDDKGELKKVQIQDLETYIK